MKHTLPDLPYPKNALIPYISAETLECHHGKHHAAYVKKLNELIPGTEFESMSLEDIVTQSGEGPIFNQAAQVWNHAFYWQSLSPSRQAPTGDFLRAIEKDFGSLEAMIQQFNQAASGVFGSGWAWLIRDDQAKKLRIETTGNAKNPLRAGVTPLLTCDVWEHAYYIDYRNDRQRFLEASGNLLNWQFAARNFTRQPGSTFEAA